MKKAVVITTIIVTFKASHCRPIPIFECGHLGVFSPVAFGSERVVAGDVPEHMPEWATRWEPGWGGPEKGLSLPHLLCENERAQKSLKRCKSLEMVLPECHLVLAFHVMLPGPFIWERLVEAVR